MVFGGVERERIQLNEDTLWSGGPKDWNNPRAPAVLREVRRQFPYSRFAALAESFDMNVTTDFGQIEQVIQQRIDKFCSMGVVKENHKSPVPDEK
mgnify:CR=1 FL=1